MPLPAVAKATINEKTISVTIKPHEIITLGIKLEK